MDYPIRRSGLANRRRDVRALCPDEHAHTERNAGANAPSGLASGRDAGPTRRRGQPVRSAGTQARSSRDRVREGPPTPMAPRLGRLQKRGSTRASLSSPKRGLARHCWLMAADRPRIPMDRDGSRCRSNGPPRSKGVPRATVRFSRKVVPGGRAWRVRHV